jgi:nicotinate-nucleotide adenylyltransferase
LASLSRKSITHWHRQNTSVGVFGGTFDPVHNAHLEFARAAVRVLSLDRLLWMPTGRPKYRQAPVASPEHRLAMLQLATAGEALYEIDERELAENATGYTVDALKDLRKQLPKNVKLYLLMGADQYGKLKTWHMADQLEHLAHIAVATRPGFESALKRTPLVVVPMWPRDISASDIRARVARGEDISSLVPPAVANYIRREGLYT